MLFRKSCVFAGASALTIALSACGGGGESHVASIPPPPPSPTPTPTPASYPVNIFPNPKPETYSSVGVGVGLSTADADQPHIRYTSGGYYEIQIPGSAYDRLVSLKGFIPQDPATNNQFQPASVAQNQAFFFTSNSRLSGYHYSEMANWAASGLGGGSVAFGSLTPSGAVPVVGSATYSGIITGGSDVTNSNSFDGVYAVPVTGTVGLNFNFATASLSGAMTLTLNDYDPVALGSFAFKDTVFSAGSTSYSGKFDTTAAGQNFFLGRFTGPNAEETIGAWALPFLFTNGNSHLPADNKAHQAFGAWIARKP